MPNPNSLSLARLRAAVRPFRVHWFARLRSTNDHAAALRKRGDLFAPAIVVTTHQTAGRGRGSNRWWSGPGCLTATFVFPIERHLAAHQLPLVAGLAVRNAAAQLAGSPDIQLRWPNDLVHRGRKLAGLLCERIHDADLIGVGINVNVGRGAFPRALRPRVTSLSLAAGRPIDLTDALIVTAQVLHATLLRRSEETFTTLLKEYDQHHDLRGRRVRVVLAAPAPPVRGECMGLDAMGRLLVRQGKQTHRVVTGRVTTIASAVHPR